MSHFVPSLVTQTRKAAIAHVLRDGPNAWDPIDWDSQGNGNSAGDRVIHFRLVSKTLR